MTFHQLQIFAAVAKHLSTTKASQELSLCQPAVCHQLKLLEEECRVKLYTRKMGRGIELTDQGRIFLNEAEVILQDFSRLKERFDGRQKNTTFVVGGSQQPCLAFLPSMLSVFKECHPKAEVALRNDRSSELERLTIKSEIELAVITIPTFSPLLVYESYRQAEIVLFVSAHHPLASRTKWTPRDLQSASLLSKRGNRTNEFLRLLSKQGIRFNGVLGYESAEAVKAMVRKGMGIGSLYREHVESDVRAGALKIIEGPQFKMAHDTSIIYRKERPLSQNAQEFLALLRGWGQKPMTVKKPSLSPAALVEPETPKLSARRRNISGSLIPKSRARPGRLSSKGLALSPTYGLGSVPAPAPERTQLRGSRVVDKP